ncbi:hypothetical protein ACA910_005524 [Epithemia clementina (nom. ined.)]
MILLSEQASAGKEASKDDYLLDSGANVHCTIKKTGMINVEFFSSQVTVGDSRQVKVTMIGDLPLTTEDNEEITLCETRVIEGFHRNIISLPILLKKGCQVNKASHCQIEIKCPNNTTLKFTRRIDNLYYLQASRTFSTKEVKQEQQGFNDISATFMEYPKIIVVQHQMQIDINKAHVLLDHTGETRLQEFAKHANWKLTGTIDKCQACIHGKAR